MPIYADATLGVTVFHVQHSSGGTWVNTTALQTNQKYRFRAYFKNFAPSTMDVPMFGGLIHVTDLTVCLTSLVPNSIRLATTRPESPSWVSPTSMATVTSTT
jgi:hypothetical protein